MRLLSGAVYVMVLAGCSGSGGRRDAGSLVVVDASRACVAAADCPGSQAACDTPSACTCGEFKACIAGSCRVFAHVCGGDGNDGSAPACVSSVDCPGDAPPCPDDRCGCGFKVCVQGQCFDHSNMVCEVTDARPPLPMDPDAGREPPPPTSPDGGAAPPPGADDDAGKICFPGGEC